MPERTPAKSVDLRPRAAPVQARALRSRRKVLDAAHALLKAHGVGPLTTVAIAEAGGVSVGALYRFFPNKESIVRELYEEKLTRIRQLGLANRHGDPATTAWRDFFASYFHALKAAEREVDFESSLADAIITLPQLWEIDQRHGVLFADQLVADMKAFGARWSDAALFDLAVNLYALDSSTWACWRHGGRYPALAIARLLEASLLLMRPAMEGEPEPKGAFISRARMLDVRAS